MSYTFKIYHKRFKIFWHEVHRIELLNYDDKTFLAFRDELNNKKLKDGNYRVVSDYSFPMNIVIKDNKLYDWSYRISSNKINKEGVYYPS